LKFFFSSFIDQLFGGFEANMEEKIEVKSQSKYLTKAYNVKKGSGGSNLSTNHMCCSTIPSSSGALGG